MKAPWSGSSIASGSFRFVASSVPHGSESSEASPLPPPSTTDRREYKRLPVSFRANLLAEHTAQTTNRVTDISMGGCTLETAATLPQGTFVELVIKPASDEEPIKIETAMVCSSRPGSVGLSFLEMVTADKNRLSQVILSLLVGQNLHQNFFS